MKSEKLSEIEALVESVVRGERVVVFPPGFWAVIATIMLFIGSTVMLSGMLISIYGQNIDVGEKVFFQFLGLVAILIFVIIPGLMVFRGHRRFRLVLKGYGWIQITGNLILIFIMFKLPVLLSLVLASLALYLIGSRWFRNCSEFYFLINQNNRYRS